MLISPAFLDEFFSRELLSKIGVPLKKSGLSVYKSCWKSHLLRVLGARPFDDPDSFPMRFYTSTKSGNLSRQSEDRYNALRALYRNLTPAEKEDLVGENAEQIERYMKSIHREVMAENLMRQHRTATGNQNMHRIGDLDFDRLKEAARIYTKFVLDDPNRTISDLRYAIIGRLYALDNAPRRREYAHLMILNGQQTEEELLLANSYTPEEGILTLNSYKTAVAYGSYTFQVSPKTQQLMNYLIPQLNSPYLFFDHSEDEAKRAKKWTRIVGDAFAEIYDERLHPTDLRKYYMGFRLRETTLYNEDLWQIATAMGTSRAKLMQNYAVPEIVI